MPGIDAYRIVNVAYGNRNYIGDLSVDIGGKHTLIVIPNGSGKTFSITLLLQTILPGISLNNRKFDETFSRVRGTAHVAISHILDGTGKRLITGITVNNEGSLRHFNWSFETVESNGIKSLPLTDGSMSISYEEMRDYIKALDAGRNPRIFNSDEKRKLKRHMKSYGIFEDEWEMMVRMNKTEGGIKNVFSTKERKNTDDLLSEFIIPTITRELKGDQEIDHVQDAFLKKIDTLKQIPEWEEKIARMDQYLHLFSSQLERLRVLYEREGDYRRQLYILKLINETTEEKKDALNEELEEVGLKIKGQREGLEILARNKALLYYRNLLFQRERVEGERAGVAGELEAARKTVKDLEDELRLIRALKDLKRYNSLRARYSSLTTMLEEKEKEDEKLREEIERLESKLFDYYKGAVEEKGNLLLSEAERHSAIEAERDEKSLEIGALKSKVAEWGKNAAYLEDIIKALEEWGGLEKRETVLKSLETVQQKMQQKHVVEEKTRATMTRLQEEKAGLTQNEFVLKEELKKAKEAHERFNKRYATVGEIQRLYHIDRSGTGTNAFEKLCALLDEKEEKYQMRYLSHQRELTAVEELLDYADRFGKLPPDKTIKKLATDLRDLGFRDFIPGYEYVRENPNPGNPLIAYGLVCENLDGLNTALKRIDAPEYPIPVFTREETAKNGESEAGRLLRQKNLFVATTGIAIEKGEVDFDAYIQDRQKASEVLKREMEKLSEKKLEIAHYIKETDAFRESYGMHPEEAGRELKEAHRAASARWSESVEATRQKADEIQEKKEALEAIKKTIDELRAEKERCLAIKGAFERLEQQSAHLIDSLDTVYDSRDHLEEQIKNGRLEIRDKTAEYDSIRKEIKGLAGRIQRLNEELGSLKQRQKAYSEGGVQYDGEPVEALEEKLRSLQFQYGDTQIREELKRTKRELDDTEKEIGEKGYSVEALNDLTKPPQRTLKECSTALNGKREQLQSLNKRLGRLEYELQRINDEMQASTVEKEGVASLNDRDYKNLLEKNRKSADALNESLEMNVKREMYVERQKHRVEVLFESQRGFLSGFDVPEKMRIKELDPAIFSQDEQEAWRDKKADFLGIKESMEKDRKTVETGWNSLQKRISSEAYEMNLNMAMVMEGDTGNVLFDYNKIKNLFEQDSHLIKTSKEMIELNIKKNRQEMETLVENAFRSVECYLTEFKNISRYSRIESHGRKDVSVKFELPGLENEEKKANLERYISAILKKINQIEKDSIAAFVRKNFSVKRLIEEIHKKKIRFRVYKPSTTAGWYYEDWDNVIKWSGGEQFFAFFLLYATMSIWIRHKRTGTQNSRTVLIADNPFGEAISEHIFNPLLEFMTENRIQFLTYTAIKERQIISLFPNKYSLRLSENPERNILYIEKGFFREE